jgi:hypothetical protein
MKRDDKTFLFKLILKEFFMTVSFHSARSQMAALKPIISLHRRLNLKIYSRVTYQILSGYGATSVREKLLLIPQLNKLYLISENWKNNLKLLAEENITSENLKNFYFSNQDSYEEGFTSKGSNKMHHSIRTTIELLENNRMGSSESQNVEVLIDRLDKEKELYMKSELFQVKSKEFSNKLNEQLSSELANVFSSNKQIIE